MDQLGLPSLAELSGLLRAGHLSAPELLDVTLRRIEALDPALGAFVEVDAEGAVAAAAAIRADDPRPFAGVPTAVKANTAVSGRVTDHGSRLFAGDRPQHDAFLVRRLRDAGFVIVGTTKMPELGILPTTEPRHGGPARNPWNRDHTPGGSSGGAAAAVASGMLPLAHGNDGGGSIRIPAACCGLFGLKPSRGRVSRGPALGDDFLVAEGALTRTVLDGALALDLLAGYEVGDATWAPRPAEPFFVSVQRAPTRLRVALVLDNVLGAPVDPVCAGAAREAAELLASLGHEVDEPEPPSVGAEGLALFTAVFAADKGRAVAARAAELGREPAEDELEPLSRAFVDLARSTSAADYLVALRRLQALARDVTAFFASYDLMVTPALAQRPLRVGALHGCGERPLEDFAASGRFAPYTALFNVSGQPAMSVPMGLGPDGLPTAAQIAGRPLADDTLLQVAAQIEAARPWGHLVPQPATAAA